MTYFQSIILGLIQGLTEFLPVSSSGHLAIFKNLFGAEFFDSGITFDIMLHLGTLAAVVAVYYKDICELFLEFFRLVTDIFCGRFGVKTPYRRLLLMLIVASIPAGIAGVLLKSFVESVSANHLWVVGVCLVFTAALLYLSDKVIDRKKDINKLKAGNALSIGIFQAVAILPGISRSGATITGGLFAGFSREFAVRFSFLLSIPTILGAALLDFMDVLKTGTNIAAGPALAGVLIAAVSGFAAIKLLLRIVKNSSFKYFSLYCIIAGVAAIVIS